MIVWLNGPFGVGKTTAARALCQELPRAQLYDPERLGWLLNRTIGLVKPGDYQDLALWRRSTIRGATRKARGSEPLIVAMSVLRPDYLHEIHTGLTARGARLHHVLLDASPETLRARALADTADPHARPWRLEQIARYQTVREQLAATAHVVSTDDLEPAEVAKAVRATMS